jgi:GNAT superfamily N-acetyltransferase
MRIRPAKASDAARIAVLATQLGYPSSTDGAAQRLAALPQDGSHAVFVAESEEGQVVSWVHVFRHLILEHDPVAYVAGLVVDAECRHGGIGKQLMQRAEEWARERRLTRLIVRSNVIRQEAHSFYEGMGYTRLKTQFVFLKEL